MSYLTPCKWSNIKAYSNETALLKSSVISITDPPSGLKVVLVIVMVMVTVIWTPGIKDFDHMTKMLYLALVVPLSRAYYGAAHIRDNLIVHQEMY